MKLERLTKEELIALVSKLEKENKKKEGKINKLEAKLRKVHYELEQALKRLEDTKHINNLGVQALFGTSTESKKKLKIKQEEKVIINEVEGEQRKKKERNTQKKKIIDTLKYCQKIIEVEIDVDFDEFGINKEEAKCFGKDTTTKIEVESVSFIVKKIVKPKYTYKGKVYEAINDDPFPHSPVTPSFVANIIVMKFILGIPLYRYSQYLESMGLNISVQDLSNYVIKAMEILEPIYEELERRLVNTPYQVIHGDETELQVVNSERSKSYMFVYTTSFWDDAIYIYKFSESRKIDNTIELFNNFNGYFVCDGYQGYNKLSKKVQGKIKIQKCFAHIRRYFVDCIKGLSEEEVAKSEARKVILLIDQLFKYEKIMREKQYTKDQIEEYRNGKTYQGVIKNLKETIKGIPYGKNILLDRAIDYYKKLEGEAYTFLENGYVDISNNLAERTVKPFVIGRKNFLFCSTNKGAIITGKLFSIVQTAKANGIKVESYLKYAMENIGKVEVKDLLPWSENIKDKFKII